MRYSIKHSGLVALCALLAPLSTAHGVELTLNPMVSINFDDMTEGDPISTLAPPWTGAGASSIVAAAPAGTGNSDALVITAPGTTRIGALSPEQTLPADFTSATTGDTLYFSAWLLKNGGGGSIVFNVNSVASGYTFTLGGFGIAEGTTGYFTYLADTNQDGVPELANSTTVAARNTWYEIALVIRLDAANYANSLGYLYYRAGGATEFTVLPEFDGVKMSWWDSSFNATNFACYRIDSARNDFQIGKLSVGKVAPEANLGMPSGAAVSH